jgi:nucleotide-binding universal stress UspA family protein
MIKRILLALDLDIDTPIATRYAISLAKQFDASLTGLAVVDTKNINQKVGVGGIGSIYYADKLRKQMTNEARQQAGKLLDKFDKIVTESGIKYAARMGEGVPYQRIIDDMKYHDLLVIGRESHFFYNRPERETGTLANIVKKSSAPTLVITESYRVPIDRVLIAHDGSMASARAIQWFVQLQPYGKDITIDVVNVCRSKKEIDIEKAMLKLHLVADFLKAHDYKDINQQVLDSEGSNAEVINNYVQEVKSDTVILGAHAVSAVRRLAFGSTTHDMVQSCPVPLFLSH